MRSRTHPHACLGVLASTEARMARTRYQELKAELDALFPKSEPNVPKVAPTAPTLKVTDPRPKSPELSVGNSEAYLAYRRGEISIREYVARKNAGKAEAVRQKYSKYSHAKSVALVTPDTGYATAHNTPTHSECESDRNKPVELDFHEDRKVPDFKIGKGVFYHRLASTVEYDTREIDGRTLYWRDDLQAWSVHPPKPKNPPSSKMRTVRTFAQLRTLVR